MTDGPKASDSSGKLVVAYGELLWDLLPTSKMLGGAPANFAYRLQSLGDAVALISRVGDDPLGDEARATLRERGLPLNLLQTDKEHPTGTVPVTLTPEGIPSFIITENVAFDYIALTPEVQAVATQASLICFGTLIQRSPVSRETLHRFLELAPQATRLLDINLRDGCYTREIVDDSLVWANILKLNDDEVQVVGDMLDLPADEFERFAGALFERYRLSHCLITRGERGALGYTRDGQRVEVPGKVVKVADTIGAGDAFTAGFVHAYLKGASFEHCCVLGNTLGAAVTTVPGGMSPVAPLDELA
jgi:fructokinase